MSRQRWFLGLMIVLASVLALNHQPPAAAKVPTDPEDRINVFDLSDEPPLGDATSEVIFGQPLPDGRCAFQIPPLVVRPGEAPRAMREQAINLTRCELTVISGTVRPEDIPAADSPPVPTRHFTRSIGLAGDSLVAYAIPESSPPEFADWVGTSTGNARVSWKDVVNAVVTNTTSTITWYHDDVCTYYLSGNGDAWWRSSTGWSYVSGYWLDAGVYGYGCTRHQVATTVHYNNGLFCLGQTVDNWVQGVWAAGAMDGSLWASVDNTWVSEPWWCPPLHWQFTSWLN